MKEFLKFIEDTPTAFHACKSFKDLLINYYFKELKENEVWNILPNSLYFVSRNDSSLIAFKTPNKAYNSFKITAGHLDSPTFKLKPNFKLERGKYIKYNTEVYGGVIYSSWFDRPLGIAGRLLINSGDKITTKLINIKKGIAFIPNLPIHYNRGVNSGVELNPQIDLLPIFGEKELKYNSLYELIEDYYDIKEKDILASDLYLTNLDRGMIVGANDEFVMAPQIDNLECSYGLIKALLNSICKDSISVCALFDNEEIGSSTMQGANSTFLSDVLKRISIAYKKSEEEHLINLANSFIISADNAQGYHPNYPSKYDETNPCFLNGGIVIKNSANGAYTTNAYSSAIFQKTCKNAGVPYQLNTNRSDIRGGSTLGAISLSHVSIPSVDIGLAQLAMHSSYETAGVKDLDYLIKAIIEFYNN